MESVAESVTDDLVGHHPDVPRLGQADKARASARRLINAVHRVRISGNAAGIHVRFPEHRSSRMIPSFDGGQPMKRRIVLAGLLMAGALSIAVAAQQQAPPKP